MGEVVNKRSACILMEKVIVESGEQKNEPDILLASPEEYVLTMVKKAKAAAGRLAVLSSHVKNQALLAMAEALENRTDEVLAANEKDVEAFGVDPDQASIADRLRLTPE